MRRGPEASFSLNHPIGLCALMSFLGERNLTEGFVSAPQHCGGLGAGCTASFGRSFVGRWGCDLIGARGDRIHLLDRTARTPISDIRARELECPPVIVAAADVKLRGMVREGEQVPAKKPFEARPSSLESGLSLFKPALRNRHIGKTPLDLGIAAGKRRQ